MKGAPRGVAILAAYYLIWGVAGLYSTVRLSRLVEEYFKVVTAPSEVATTLSTLSLTAVETVAVHSLISIAVAYGLFTGRGWAWYVAAVFTAAGVAVGAVAVPSRVARLAVSPLGLAGGLLTGASGLATGALVLYYLTRPHVREFFGNPTLP